MGAPGGGAPYSPFGGPNAPLMTQQQQQRSYPAINNARADYERELAGMVGSQARIDELDARMRDRRSISPRQGVILRRFVRLGDIVQPGQPIADIGDVDALDVRIEAPIAQVEQIRMNDPVPVTVNAINLWATVRQIYPAAEGQQRTVTVKLALPQGVAAAPGMYARAWIAQPGGGGLTPAIPSNAIAYRGSLPVAFVSTAHGVDMRILRLGDSMGDRTAVLSGLMAGERVLVNPPPDLKAGEALAKSQ
jgi:RND family efflux transporter MFP subunit